MSVCLPVQRRQRVKPASCHQCICLRVANKAIAGRRVAMTRMKPSVGGLALHCKLVALVGTLFGGFQKAGPGLEC